MLKGIGLVAMIAGFSSAAWGQPVLTLSSATGATGGTVALNLSVSSPSGSQPAALEWTFTYPSASVSSFNVAAGAAATAAGKSITCTGGATGYTCIASGMNSTLISNGVVAVVTATLTSSATTAAIGVPSFFGVDATGAVLNVTGTGGTITISQAAKPVTVTSVSCTPTLLSLGATLNCSVQLSAAAGTGGAVVTLASTSTALTLPASVTVAAGSSTATFTATAASLVVATITATLNSSSATASISLTPLQVSSVQCSVSSLTPSASTTCSATLNQAAPSTGVTITLKSSVTTLTVPASATAAGGTTSAPFTITAGSFTSSQTATVTATYNGTTAQTSISLSPSAAISSVVCATTSLSPATATNCTATLSAKATSAVVISLASSTTAITVPASVSVPANATTVSFPASAGSFKAGQSVKITATSGTQSASATITLTTTAPTTRFSFAGVGSELGGVANGSAVSPDLAPSGLGGKVVVNGTGSVNLVSGSGMYFLNCCANTNDAYLKFTGVPVGTVFNLSQGQLSFTLTSRYSFSQRKSSASGQRYAFDVRDANGHQYYFMTQIVSGTLVFYYQVGGTQFYYYVPSGTEDQLFGSGVSLKVGLSWTASSATLSLNGTTVKTSAYTPAATNWSSASNFDIGAYEYLTYGGYNVSDDVVGSFVVSGPAATTAGSLLTKDVVRRTARPAPPLGSSSTLSCEPAAAGSSTLCELKTNSGDLTDDAELAISSSSDGVLAPPSVTMRRGTGKAQFQVLAQPDAPEGTVAIEVQSGADTIRTSLPVAHPGTPALAVPGRQAGIPGQSLQFGVIAADERPHALAASSLPSGATFDTSTGTFTWVPTEHDLGTHTIYFTATNSLGLSTSKAVEVTVTRELSGNAPEILTVGVGGQALAVHAGSAVLAAIPNALFNGLPARADDQLSVSVRGVDCNQNPAVRNFQLKFGAAYVPVESIQPNESAPGVCSVSFAVPAGAAEGQTPVSIDAAGPAGRVLSSNVATIAVMK